MNSNIWFIGDVVSKPLHLWLQNLNFNVNFLYLIHKVNLTSNRYKEVICKNSWPSYSTIISLHRTFAKGSPEVVKTFLILRLCCVISGARKIAPQQIPPWVRVRVWVKIRMVGNFPGRNFPGTVISNTISVI